MKRIIISSVIFLTLCLHSNLNAQGKDSFLDYRMPSSDIKGYESGEMKSDIDTEENRAPIGAGLFVLGALALGYASLKNNEGYNVRGKD
mgnify:FL=1